MNVDVNKDQLLFDFYKKEFSAHKEWVNMPEFIQKRKRPFKLERVDFIDESHLFIRFENEFNYHRYLLRKVKYNLSSFNCQRELFSKVVDQKITDKTKSIWYPFKSHRRKEAQPVWVSDDAISNKYPIYVISKGRFNNCLTAKELIRIGVEFYLVVEPQEYEDYKKEFPNVSIIKTPFSNLGEGSIPVRNFVLEHSLSNGFKRHWVLDDNISNFHRLNKNEKYKVDDGRIFKICEEFTDRYKNVKISGMNYYSFAKATDPVPPFQVNTRIYSCILIDNSIKHRWRGKYNEDTDLSIRVLKDGDCTILFNAFLCGKTTTLRMKGGNTGEVYGGTDNRKEFAESLRDQHPDVVDVVWRFNRWHHQVNYKPFKKNKLIKKDGLKIIEGVNNYGMELRKP